MALIFLTGNSKGIGQTVRSAAICDVLAKGFTKPTIFAQGQNLETFFNGHKGRCIPFFSNLPKEEQETLAKDIENYALFSEPSVLIEDTCPIAWSFPGSISRALVLCPGEYSYLKQLRKRWAEQIGTWLIADSPGSPTWLYNTSQTKELLNRENVKIIGPVYRKTNAEDIKAACKLISHDPDQPVCLFTMGSSQRHLESDYVEKFIQVALLIQVRLKSVIPNIRCIFVKGVLFDCGVPIPPGFEILEQVDCMPALLNISFAAVIRPGFNLIWECIDGRTPFLAIEGETSRVPGQKYINYLRQQGLYPDSPFRDWPDKSFLPGYKHKCDEIVNKFDGVPDISVFKKLLDKQKRPAGRGLHVRKGKDGNHFSKRILFVVENGIGIGHIVRTLHIALEMKALGHDVHFVFESANTWANDTIPIPFTSIRKYKYDGYSVLRQYYVKLNEIIDNFDPHAVVFDRQGTIDDIISRIASLRFCYKAAITSVPSVDLLARILERKDVDKTILLHSEKDFQMMYGSQVYQKVAGTDSIMFAGGPIYPRNSTFQHKEAVKVPAEPFVVFINGGGGEHHGKKDTEIIARIVNHAAKMLGEIQNIKTIFIGGPNFKHYDLIDHKHIQCVTFASNIIELMEAARVTVLRPGFNLTREAYNSARAIIALQTYQRWEATGQHFSLLMNHPAFKVAALDADDVYKTIITLLSRENMGKPPSLWKDGLPAVVHLLSGDEINTKPLGDALTYLESLRSDKKKLIIRIDDVVTLDEPLAWLLTKLAERKLFASLEVVPYHTDIDESDLNAYDPSHRLFEVSQHGYSHLSIQPLGVPPGEFPCDISKDPGADDVIESIRRGRNFIAQKFPKTFSGGFSAPFDACPAWLPTLWADLGGKFISTIFCHLERSPIPVVQLAADLWNWEQDRQYSLTAIFSSLTSWFDRYGQAGLVFHHKKLTAPDDRADMETLLDTIIKTDITSIKLSDCASAILMLDNLNFLMAKGLRKDY